MTNLMATLFTLFVLKTLSAGGWAPRCDDGMPVTYADGSINLRCVIEGCSIAAGSCWGYRIEHCYDSTGRENDDCVLEDKACHNSFSCAWQFAVCKGAFECIEDGWAGGCKKGICMEDTSEDE